MVVVVGVVVVVVVALVLVATVMSNCGVDRVGRRRVVTRSPIAFSSRKVKAATGRAQSRDARHDLGANIPPQVLHLPGDPHAVEGPWRTNDQCDEWGAHHE